MWKKLKVSSVPWNQKVNKNRIKERKKKEKVQEGNRKIQKGEKKKDLPTWENWGWTGVEENKDCVSGILKGVFGFVFGAGDQNSVGSIEDNGCIFCIFEISFFLDFSNSTWFTVCGNVISGSSIQKWEEWKQEEKVGN